MWACSLLTRTACECVRASGHRLRSEDGAALEPARGGASKSEFALLQTWLDAWNAQIARFAKNGSTGSEYLKTGSRGWMRNFQRTPPPRVANCDTGVRHGTRAPSLSEA